MITHKAADKASDVTCRLGERARWTPNGLYRESKMRRGGSQGDQIRWTIGGWQREKGSEGGWQTKLN